MKEDLLDQVRHSVENEEYQYAIRQLMRIFAYEEINQESLQLYAYALRMVGDPISAEIIEQVLTDQHSAMNQMNLGLYFMREGLYECAITPLKKCIELYEGEPFFHLNIGITFLKLSRIPDAIRHLEFAFRVAQDQMAAYYLAYAFILMKNPVEARKYALHTDDKHREAIGKILKRFDNSQAINSYREWYFSQTGRILLRTSLETEQEFKEDIEKGLYTVLPLTNSRLIDTLSALQTILGTLGGTFQAYDRIGYLGSRSKPAAEIYAKIKKLPVVKADSEMITAGGILLFAADTNEIETQSDLIAKRQNTSILFSLTYDWTRDGTILPDVVGYMTQFSYLPWEPAISTDDQGTLVTVANTESDNLLDDAMLADLLTQVDFDFLGKLINFCQDRQVLIEVGGSQHELYQRQSPVSAVRYF